MNPRLALSSLLLLGLVGCSTPPALPPEDTYRDPVLVQYDASARAAVADQNYERAARFYEQALIRARTADLGLEAQRRCGHLDRIHRHLALAGVDSTGSETPAGRAQRKDCGSLQFHFHHRIYFTRNGGIYAREE